MGVVETGDMSTTKQVKLMKEKIPKIRIRRNVVLSTDVIANTDKQGLDKNKLEKFVVDKLTDGGYEVRSQPGDKKLKNIIFLNFSYPTPTANICASLSDLVSELNSKFWNGFMVWKTWNKSLKVKEVNEKGERPTVKGYKCDVCMFYTSGKNEMDSHKRGKRHMKKAVGQLFRYTCSLCSFTTNSVSSKDTHVQGKKHRKREKANATNYKQDVYNVAAKPKEETKHGSNLGKSIAIDNDKCNLVRLNGAKFGGNSNVMRTMETKNGSKAAQPAEYVTDLSNVCRPMELEAGNGFNLLKLILAKNGPNILRDSKDGKPLTNKQKTDNLSSLIKNKHLREQDTVLGMKEVNKLKLQDQEHETDSFPMSCDLFNREDESSENAKNLRLVFEEELRLWRELKSNRKTIEKCQATQSSILQNLKFLNEFKGTMFKD